MNNQKEKLAEKLFANREKDTPAKNDCAALLKAVFAENIDASLNDNPELAEAVNEVLSRLSSLERYCLEERFLHGKTLEQLTEEFREAIDLEEFAEKYAEKALQTLYDEFMDHIDGIFYDMQNNSFGELKASENPASPETADDGRGACAADILRDTIKDLDGRGFCYREIFEGYFLEGESKTSLTMALSDDPENPFYVTDEYIDEICETLHDLFMDKIEAIFDKIKDNNFDELKNPALDFDWELYVGFGAYDGIYYILRILIAMLDQSGIYLCQLVFISRFIENETNEQLARLLSENMTEYVKVTCADALRHIRTASRSQQLKRFIGQSRA